MTNPSHAPSNAPPAGLPDDLADDLAADLPDAFVALLEGYGVSPDSVGQSGATVLLLDHPQRRPLVLKLENRSPLEELPREIQRMRWLGAQGLPCPDVVATHQDERCNALLMSRAAGHDLSVLGPDQPLRCVEHLADALRRLHALPVENCPFDQGVNVLSAGAAARIAADAVDLEDFYEDRTDQTPQQLFDLLNSNPPATEDRVVTHGDACFPNFIVAGEDLTAFIDLGRLGVADRHQDLALAARSIEMNLGAQWLAPFYARYGREPDPAKLEFYRLMDEFF